MVQKDATAWERWVYLFAQLRQLAVLAPRLPTKDPQLRGSAYEMVLHAFLLSPADHPRLLKLLETWPPHLYSLPALTQAVVQRCAPQHAQAAIDWEPSPDSSVPCWTAARPALPEVVEACADPSVFPSSPEQMSRNATIA